MGGLKGTVTYDPKDPSKDVVNATLDVSTINTNNSTRDEKLKADYFDLQKFPTIAFHRRRSCGQVTGN